MSSNDRIPGKNKREHPKTEETSLETRSPSIESGLPNIDKTPSTQITTVFLNFSFYKVDPKWRWLNELGKEEAAKEFASLIEVANTKMKVQYIPPWVFVMIRSSCCGWFPRTLKRCKY